MAAQTYFSFVSDQSTSLVSDSETMPRHLGIILERLTGVWSLVWMRVELSGKRRGDFFAYL